MLIKLSFMIVTADISWDTKQKLDTSYLRIIRDFYQLKDEVMPGMQF